MKITGRFMLLLVMVVAACDSGKGPDSLFGQSPHAASGTVSPCIRCHSSSNSPGLDPLVTGGTGTAGKHVKHVTERGIDCEVCHKDYMSNPNHMNGTIDIGSASATAVSFNVTGPSGAWVNAAEPRTGNCSGVACHGTATMEWYGTSGWTLPACAECHSPAFSASLNPVATNGEPPAGRHGKHVSSRGIGCERCHYQYPSRLTHMNGRLDIADASVSLVNFNITGPSGSWMNYTGPGTGQCSGVACHGTDTLDWYGTGTWALPPSCTTCHASSFSSVLDPVLTNGSGLSGKHVRHAASLRMACTKCHLGYASGAPHMSGIMDTQDPTALLVTFDATNTLGAWVSDSGPQTGGCSTLTCHPTEIPEWYGLAGVLRPPCAVCHSDPIAQRRAVMGAGGDFGANASVRSHHATNGPGSDPVTDQCFVCHDMSLHMGGTVRLNNADTGEAIAYSAVTPTSGEPFCLSCHDADGATATFRTGGTPTAPFIDGSVLGQTPYRAGIDIRDSWNKTFGHKQKGITCLSNSAPNTGCHANGHGSAFVGILPRNMQIPQPDRYRETDFDICFNCHQSFPAVTKEVVFGVRFGGNYDQAYGPNQIPLLRSIATVSNPPYDLPDGIQTKFRDRNDQLSGNFYDNRSFFPSTSQTNLHWFHIGLPWNYRGTALNLNTSNSGISCTACHSVHGSNTQWGMVYDTLLYSHTTVSLDTFSMMSVDLATLNQYPTYCAFNCHNVIDVTHGWFEPANEVIP